MPNIDAFGPVFHEKKIFFSQFFASQGPPKKVSPFILTNMNLQVLLMLLTKLGYHWVIGS